MSHGEEDRAALSHQVMERTCAFVHDFYDAKSTLVEEALADDFVWVGAQPNQYTHGKAEFLQTYEAIMREAAHVRTFDLAYTLDALEPTEHPRIALATVSYFLATDPTQGQIFADQQRCTFVWRVLDAAENPQDTPGEKDTSPLELLYLHASNPTQQAELPEHFPVRAGVETYRYVARTLRGALSRNKTIQLVDTEGTAHWVDIDDIVSAHSQGKRTLAHCVGQDVLCPVFLGELADELDGTLVRVHRCHAVNPSHVVALAPGKVTLDDGTDVPVPERRFREVKDALAEALGSVGSGRGL